MPDPKRSSNSRMSESEAVLVDVVRLVARGEADAVPKRVSKLLRGVGGRRAQQLSEPCRDALSRAVADAGPPSTTLRRTPTLAEAPPAPAEREIESEIPSGVHAPTLSVDAQRVLDRLLAEHEHAEKLGAAGIAPTRSLLLSGPPGVGKTMTATYIASRLGLPLVRAEPSTIVTSLLGESARNLAGAFAAARRTPSLLLLDEFDAFAKRRDDTHEVGELKRFVTTLLVELERGLPHGILVAATNHPDLLDPAVHRRFDASIELSPPDLRARQQIIETALADFAVAVDPATVSLLAELTESRSGSDLQRLVNDGIRAHLLADEGIDFTLLRAALEHSRGPSRDARAQIARVASASGLSTRAVGRLLDCSHTSVMRMLADQPEAA
jgi:MoxR-like ATPase